MSARTTAATTTAPAGTLSGAPTGTPKIGLRERKKIQTRQAIRRAAYRLFDEQGYDATPVDRIAEAADVSPSTVFRYFPTKEDIVLTDEYDPLIEAAIRARPADESPLQAIRYAFVESLRAICEDPQERADLSARAKLLRDVPAVRARSMESMSATGRILAGVLAERTGRPVDDLELRIFTGAVLGAFQEATMHWGEHDQQGELLDVVERTLDVLERGLTL
ncbi:TetR family transcriptional regulator [Streptomyces sp. RKAG293]|uniref:TetR/AcrR family transcriptional regulator n=1 Tax=Streptomyces sp. RKAG293 TaxID=2893403 RepID=UPI0020333DE0|nr:TetR family transcriptional regulator [Streptomyces sp. RKAG293]MCM2421298.1 TetR family transcriptional regulator [Streptomyces sp. RKAG293]